MATPFPNVSSSFLFYVMHYEKKATSVAWFNFSLLILYWKLTEQQTLKPETLNQLTYPIGSQQIMGSWEKSPQASYEGHEILTNRTELQRVQKERVRLDP